MPWLGAALLLICIVTVFTTPRPALDVAPLGVLGVVFAAMPLITRMSARRRARKFPSLNNLVKWKITESELQHSMDGAEARFVWGKIIEVHEWKSGFLLFPQPRLVHWLPKHGFKNDSDIELFRELPRRKPIKYKG
jgi:hypothetical protein